MMSSEESDVLFETLNYAEVITLNRPYALNSLNLSMAKKVLQKLQEIENARSLVIMKGAGGKSFCAGGNLKLSYEETPTFINIQYNISNLVGKYKIPCISLLNGIAMGAGLGISTVGRYRVATENSVIAMPETKVGICPDAGGTYFLPRLQSNIGIYLGLTGHRLKGNDVLKVGVATHFVRSEKLCELEKSLSSCKNDLEVQNVLNQFNKSSKEFSLEPNIKHIDYCFAASTVEKIIKRLEKVQNDWSTKTLETLNQMSPTALKITLRALRYGLELDLPDCLRMEFRINLLAVHANDFNEGVRAVLIEKGYKPQWKPKTLAEVSDDYVERYFNKLPQEKELFLFDEYNSKL